MQTQSSRAAFVRRQECPSCGGRHLEHVWRSTFASPELRAWMKDLGYTAAAYAALDDQPIELVRCSLCALMFHRLVLTDEGFGVLYSEWIDGDQIEQAERALGLDHDWAFEHGVQWVKHVLRVRDLLEPRFDGPFRLLDFGCGDGQFLHFTRGFGFEAIGVDLSASRRMRAAGIDIVPALEELDPRWLPLHAVSLFEVLEHLPEPRAVLEALRDRLAPGGVLIVEVPDCTDIEAPRTQQAFRHVAPPEHINCFTPRTLSTLCARAGFSPLPRAPAWVTTRAKDLVKTGLSRVYRPERTSAYFQKA